MVEGFPKSALFLCIGSTCKPQITVWEKGEELGEEIPFEVA